MVKRNTYPRPENDPTVYPIMVGVGSHSFPAIYVGGKIIFPKEEPYKVKKK
jgi:hypothetical protein